MENNGGKLQFTVSLDNRQLRQDAAAAQQQLSQIGSTAQRESQRMDRGFTDAGRKVRKEAEDTTAVLKKMGAAIGGIFAVGQLKQFATQVATVRGQFQQLEVAFTTMLGSAEKANALMSQLITTAATTPFGMSDLANSAKQLLAYGLEADKVNDTLIRLGDIAAGLSIPINDLAYLYGTTMVQGRLYTQDLNQFLGRGIPLVAELAAQFGVAESEVKNLVTEGKVGFPEVEKAIISMTSAGSQFGGLMEAQSHTITGQISNLEDSIEQMMNEIGRSNEGTIGSAISLASSAVEHYEQLGRAITGLIAVYGTYRTAVMAVTAAKGWATAAEALHYNWLLLVEKAQKLLNATMLKNPYVLAATAIAAVVAALTALATASNDAEEAQNRLNAVNEQYNANVGAEIVKIDSMFAKLQAAKRGTEEYAAAKQDIINQYGNYLQGLDSEVSSLENVAAAYEAVKNSAIAAAKARALTSATSEAADVYGQAEARAKSELSDYLRDFYGNRTDGGGMLLSEKDYAVIERAILSGEKLGEDFLKRFDTAEVQGSAITGGIQGYVDNRVRTLLNDIDRARSIYEDTVAKANRMFSGAAIEQAVNNATATTPTTTTPTSTATPSARTTATDRTAAQTERRKQEIAAYGEEIAQAEAEAAFAARQAAIDADEDGFEKQMKQAALNYDRLIAENDRRREEMIEGYKDNALNEWLIANPNATQAQQQQYRASLNITEADLPQQQQNALKEYAQIAAEARVRAERAALQEILRDVQTYEQRRLAVTEQYQKRREALYTTDADGNRVLREGVTQGNVEELDAQEQEALAAVDEQFAQREQTYQAWCDSIASMTLEKLQETLTAAQTALQQAETSGASGTQIAKMRAQVNRLKQQIAKLQGEEQAADPDAAKSWTELSGALGEAGRGFKELGEEIGGTVGEVLTAAGTVATSTASMVQNMVGLVTSSAATMTGVSATAAAAISTMEKASAILAIISAAIQIGTAIAGMFNNDAEYSEEIDALQLRIDQLQWELDNSGTTRVQSLARGIDVVNAALEQTRKEMGLVLYQGMSASEMLRVLNNSILTNNELLAQSASKVADVYADMAYTADKALGEERFASSREQLENIGQQMQLVNRQLKDEQSKKDPDDSALADYEQKIAELGQQMLDVINDMVEEIMGGSSTDIANELADAFWEAFKEGEDAAAAWGDTVQDIIADITRSLLVQKFLEEPLGELFDKYKAQWFKNGEFAGVDTVLASLSSLESDLMEVGENWTTIWDTLPDSVKEMLNAATEQTREAAQTGIANASQESVDELNGRATAIQGHTYSISENTKLLLSTTQSILQSVVNIDLTTEAMNTRLAAVESGVAGIRSAVDDITTRGLKIK